MNREDFKMLNNDLIYFDNGATTLKPNCVIAKIVDYYENYSANAHRGDYDISLKVDKTYEGVREQVRQFINAKRVEEIVFTSGATESLNFIVNGFFKNNLEAGDEILLTYSEHASNILPWFNLAKTNNIVIKFIHLDDNHYVTLDNVKKMITPKTKVISLASITNVIGDLRPIKEITKLAHEHNIFMITDASQSIGHMVTDVIDTDTDFLVFSAHKMNGPTGVGVLYGKYELLNELTPINLGGGMNESFDNINEMFYKELPTRLEAGTPNIAGVIGLGEAINYLSNIGLNKINNYERELREYLVNALIKIDHIDMINIEADAPIVSFNVTDIFSQDVAVYLNKYHVCVRAGNHCAKLLKNEIGVKNTLRVSLAYYNTFEEIDTLIELLENRERIIKEML